MNNYQKQLVEKVISNNKDQIGNLSLDADVVEISGKEEKKKQSDELIQLMINEQITLFADTKDHAYVRLPVQDHLEIWPLSSQKFKAWICHKFYSTFHTVPNSSIINDALSVLSGMCLFNGAKFELQTRVAAFDNAIWYDLGDWTAIKITSTHHEIIQTPPILFKHYSHQKPQVKPNFLDIKSIYKLRRYINVSSDDDFDLLLVYLVTTLLPNIPHPILLVHGEQGSAKSTLFRLIKRLIDPSVIETLSLTKDMQETIQMISHHWFIPIDNMSYIQDWMSDYLCRVVTGDGFSKRELYTNDEDVIYTYKRCVAINGINQMAEKSDLLDRSLIIELHRISDQDRIIEREFWKNFEQDLPDVLGGLFLLLSATIGEYSHVTSSSFPRMADFAKWGCAVMLALGYTENKFIDLFKGNIRQQNQVVMDSNPIASVIQEFMQDKDVWEGTPVELLDQMNPIAEQLKVIKDNKYPHAPNWVMRRINEVRPNLIAERIEITENRGTRRNITIRKFENGVVTDVTDDPPTETNQAEEGTRQHDSIDSILIKP